ncbi:hypothetical protein DB30_03539 [Enhygromyxa salina]|uniref:Uncharacterized protein n=1 Tax=Enhygromyxa salina TaxID=215803 RepID=A0A0C2D1X9_9BACT|nr:hypothetical protein [Enhygromyxa salina]KIG17226.1 hypothetical protein DB30_03539 [Enhygromyxa salina]
MSRKYKVLTPIEARIVGALGQTMYPRGGNIPVDARDARALEYVDEWLAAVPKRERVLLRLMFVLFEVAMPAFGPSRTKTFTRASPEAQHAYLAAWETSDLYFRRVSLLGLRSVFAFAYLADAEVLRHIGVDDGVEILRRQRASAGKTKTVADLPGADIDSAANVAVLSEAVDAVRVIERERRAAAARASGGDN